MTAVPRSDNRLRLLHVIHTLDPAAGGAVSAARSMCAALAARGHDITLYATGPRREDQSGAYFTRIFPMEFPPMAVSAGFARALKDMRDVDLVHVHMLYRFPQAAAAAFCRRNAIPYCVQPHGALEPVLFHKRERRGFKRLYERLVENRNLNSAAGLIYTAKGEADAVRFLNLRPAAFVIPLGLDLAQFDCGATGFRDRHGLAGMELVVWVGWLVPVKGLDILITAFAALARQRPHARLVLVGPDPEGYGTALLGTKAAEAVGVDIDAGSIRHAQSTYGSATIRFVEGSCTELPLPDASFDVVVSFETIEHLDAADQQPMLAEFARVLKPAGLLIISSPNKRRYSDARDYINEFHRHELYRDGLAELLAKAFPAQRWFHQDVAPWSSIWSEDEGDRVEAWLGDAGRVSSYVPPEGMYFIVVAARTSAAFSAMRQQP